MKLFNTQVVTFYLMLPHTVAMPKMETWMSKHVNQNFDLWRIGFDIVFRASQTGVEITVHVPGFAWNEESELCVPLIHVRND